MFSFPLFERLKAETAGVRGAHGIPGRRRAPERAAAGRRDGGQAAALRIRHRQLLLDARRRRVRRPRLHRRRRHAGRAAGRRAEPPRLAGHLRRRSVASSARRSFIEGHPFTVVGVAPPGFFGETLRGDPPDLWIPLQQEPLINGDTSILRQPISAWLRVIGRLRPGATTDGMGPRLTGVLRQWMQHDSGLSGELDARRHPVAAEQVIAVVPAGAGVGVMKEQYGRSLQILLGVCGLVLLIACANVANLLLARAVARRGQTAVRLAMGASRRQIVTQALVESVLLAIAGGVAGLVVADGAARLLLALAFAGRDVPADRHAPVADGAGVRVRRSRSSPASCSAPRRRGSRRAPIRSTRLRGAGRSTGDHSSFARKALLVVQATLSVVLVAGSTMLARSLGNLESQDFGFEIQGRVLVSVEPAAARPTRRRSSRRSIATSRSGSIGCPACRVGGLALYNPLTDNWGELVLVAGHPAPKPGRTGRRVVGSRQRELPPEPRREARARPLLHRRRQRNDRERRRRQRSVRPPLLQERRRSARSALRPRPAGKRRHLPHRRHRPRREVRRLRARSAGAADVLRRARADRRSTRTR